MLRPQEPEGFQRVLKPEQPLLGWGDSRLSAGKLWWPRHLLSSSSLQLGSQQPGAPALRLQS